ncbi:MAG TPA: hypothetical protein VH985_10870 [Candidatus Binatia bacterium]|jgi:hypothetical protein
MSIVSQRNMGEADNHTMPLNRFRLIARRQMSKCRHATLGGDLSINITMLLTSIRESARNENINQQRAPVHTGENERKS